MRATRTQLEAVLKAAGFLLGARQDRTLALDEWVDLARAVAAATGRTTAEWLAESDLAGLARERPADWDPRRDGALPGLDGD